MSILAWPLSAALYVHGRTLGLRQGPYRTFDRGLALRGDRDRFVGFATMPKRSGSIQRGPRELPVPNLVSERDQRFNAGTEHPADESGLQVRCPAGSFLYRRISANHAQIVEFVRCAGVRCATPAASRRDLSERQLRSEQKFGRKAGALAHERIGDFPRNSDAEGPKRSESINGPCSAAKVKL